MLDLKDINQPGEHPFMFQGKIGAIEALITIPVDADPRYMVILGHPHSLQGGAMNNKVVTTLARVFKDLNIASIRFNFRGVGHSAGEYDAGIGESEDMLLLAEACQKVYPYAQLVFAGFSFGSYVTYRAAAQCPHALLISIAPAVHHYDYTEFPVSTAPWIVVQGDADEVVPIDEVRDFVTKLGSSVTYVEFADTGHFFHGKLIELKSSLIETIQTKGLLCH